MLAEEDDDESDDVDVDELEGTEAFPEVEFDIEVEFETSVEFETGAELEAGALMPLFKFSS